MLWSSRIPQLILGSLVLMSIVVTGLALIILLDGEELTSEPTALPTQMITAPLIIASEVIPTVTSMPTILPASATPVATETFAPPSEPTLIAAAVTESGCPMPDSWTTHTVAAGETLFAYQLGAENTVTVDQILQANCLTDRFIYEGQVLWLPPGAAENAPSSESVPTALAADPNAPAPPQGLTRSPRCPCEITIRAGWRLEQIAELIDSLPVGFYGRDFLAAARSGLPAYEFMGGAASVEGYMLPGTYTITNEMNAQAFRDLVLAAFDTATRDLWGAAAAQGLTPYQAVILASIIVRESGSYDQQVLISSVFHNRLKAGTALGATVTTQYALGRSGNWWGNVQGQVSTFQSPYNTNLNTGLPPTPIASASLDALRAAAQPAQTNFLFFTGNCRGAGNVFAETYEQHLANARCE